MAQDKGIINSKLNGVVLIDAWISPIDSVLSWAPFLFHTGMVDRNGYEVIKKSAEKTEEAVKSGNWTLAFYLSIKTKKAITSATHNINFYNILEKVEGINTLKKCHTLPIYPGSYSDEIHKLYQLMNGKVKETLGLNMTNCDIMNWKVSKAVIDDHMKPATDIVGRLLSETNLQIVILTGQLDLIVATPGTLTWVEKLKWNGDKEWHKSVRNTFNVNNIAEGYVKEYGNLKMYWINRAGHMIPKDNPDAMKAVLHDLTSLVFCDITDNQIVNNIDGK